MPSMSATLPDLTPFFKKYEILVASADALFKQIHDAYPQEVICKKGCSSCCHALFDLSLVEALYLNTKFNELIADNMQRFEITNRASGIDRQTTKVKRELFRSVQKGKGSNEVLEDAAHLTMRCPLLSDDDACLLYEARPVTCRIYGVPTAIGGKSLTCGKTGFQAGVTYPTVYLDKIQEYLAQLSAELAEAIDSSYTELATMYVPVSTALITTYDASYLGIGGIPKED